MVFIGFLVFFEWFLAILGLTIWYLLFFVFSSSFLIWQIQEFFPVFKWLLRLVFRRLEALVPLWIKTDLTAAFMRLKTTSLR